MARRASCAASAVSATLRHWPRLIERSFERWSDRLQPRRQVFWLRSSYARRWTDRQKAWLGRPRAAIQCFGKRHSLGLAGQPAWEHALSPELMVWTSPKGLLLAVAILHEGDRKST